MLFELTISFSSSRIHVPASPTSPTTNRTFSDAVSVPLQIESFSAAFCNLSCDLPTRIIVEAPSCKKRSAIAKPIPEVPPVTMQVRPDIRLEGWNFAIGLVVSDGEGVEDENKAIPLVLA